MSLVKHLCSTAALVIFVSIASSANAAPLFGQSLTGAINGSSSITVASQFASPATVGNGIEFTGSINDLSFGQNFTITADFSASSLVIHFTDPTVPTGNVRSGDGSRIFDLAFGSTAGFPTITGVVHSCDASASFCASNPATVPVVTAGTSAIDLGFSSIFSGDIYTVSFASTTVPEAGTWAMMILGAGTVGAAMRRQRRRKPGARLAI